MSLNDEVGKQAAEERKQADKWADELRYLDSQFALLARDFAQLAPDHQLAPQPIGWRAESRHPVQAVSNDLGWLIAEHADVDKGGFQHAVWITAAGKWQAVGADRVPFDPETTTLMHWLSQACQWASGEQLVKNATTLCAARLRGTTPVFSPLRLP